MWSAEEESESKTAERAAEYRCNASRHSLCSSSSADAAPAAILPRIQTTTGVNRSTLAHGPFLKRARASGLCTSTKCLATTVVNEDALSACKTLF